MPVRRLTELNNLSAASLTPRDDYMHIIDESAAVSGKNKKITAEELARGLGGIGPIPYMHVETFRVHNADVHNPDNKRSHSVPHIWVAPPAGEFPNQARIRCYGAGGGGGGGNNANKSGGGGGAGAFAESVITYTPGRKYLIYVGQSGSRGIGFINNEDGADGLDGTGSKVVDDTTSTILISAAPGSGGQGGYSNNTGGNGGNGGQAANCIGDRTVNGAAGANNGTNNLLGGTGGKSYTGGVGGRGGSATDSGDARDGSFPAAGGGGGTPNSGTNRDLSHGGNGAHGLVTIEYNNSPATYSYNVHSP